MPDFNRRRSPPQGAGASRGGGEGGARSASPARSGSAPRPALPWYVGTDFQEAPPGHRYLLYLPFWNDSWGTIKDRKQRELAKLTVIPPHVGDATRALVARQVAIGEGSGAKLIRGKSTSPFATGLGWEHPNENGFAFLQPYGVPYLAGSGVKGVLRDAAQHLAQEPDGNSKGWSLDAVTQLFGPPAEEIRGPKDARRGALRFFDVIPIIDGAMGVDIMNPHHGDYYQGTSTPNDAGQPKPIFFLVVPPGSKFTFIVDCPRAHRLSEDLRANWGEMILAAFSHAFDWLGFGAKTAVGYGAMAVESARLTPGKPAVEGAALPRTTEEVWPSATLTLNPGTGRLHASFQDRRTAPLERKMSEELIAALGEPAARLKRDKMLTKVRLRVRVEGNMITLLGLAP